MFLTYYDYFICVISEVVFDVLWKLLRSLFNKSYYKNVAGLL